MNNIRNRYRTSDIHDVMDIARYPESSFDPEPSTLSAVSVLPFTFHSIGVYENGEKSR